MLQVFPGRLLQRSLDRRAERLRKKQTSLLCSGECFSVRAQRGNIIPTLRSVFFAYESYGLGNCWMFFALSSKQSERQHFHV